MVHLSPDQRWKIDPLEVGEDGQELPRPGVGLEKATGLATNRMLIIAR